MPSPTRILGKLKIIAPGALSWTWAGSLSATLLCWLPWFEFSQFNYALLTGAAAALLTLIGTGPNHFAARAASPFVQWLLRELVRGSRGVVKLLLKVLLVLLCLNFLLFFIISYYAIVPALVLRDLLSKSSRQDAIITQVLFKRGNATVQYRSAPLYPQYRPVIVRPLSPFFNFLTELPPDQPDSTWVVVSVPTPPLTYLPEQTKEWQASLLEQVRDYRRQQRHEAALAARVFNTLHFELSAATDSLDGSYNSRSERRPLPDSLSDTSLYARLGSDRVLRIRANDLRPGVLSITLTGFRGVGHYELGNPPPDTSLVMSGPGYVELLHYDQGVGVAYRSAATSPVRLIITRYDAAQRLIAGTFEGVLQAPADQTATIEEGSFEVRFQ